ncbi:MAG: DUF4375 domain-containing protein [Planctomycetota bacterium]
MTIDGGESAAKVFRALKRFDGNVTMGTALQQIRERDPFDILLDCSDREDVLVRLLELLEELERLQIAYEISANNVPRSSHLWEPLEWKRSDVLSALRTLRQNAAEADDERKRRQIWLESREGREYVAAIERLNEIRDFVRYRWDSLGFDGLRPSEKDYLYGWWLCVEVDSGAFDQYFYNSTGDFALLALSALQTLKTPKAHSILSDALQLFEPVGGFTPDRAERCERLHSLPEGTFDDVTRRFYDLPEDIRAIALMEVDRDYEQNGITP